MMTKLLLPGITYFGLILGSQFIIRAITWVKSVSMTGEKRRISGLDGLVSNEERHH